MGRPRRNRLLVERPLSRDGRERGSKALPARSVTVNLAESPLGWLRSRGLVSERQFEAGDRLRREWELAQIEPSVTMKWDAAPTSRMARSAPEVNDPSITQLSARLRFEHAVNAVGPGLSEVLWRVVCAGEGMRDAERALGWPARAGKLVLGLALDRLADYYRIR